jgi:hypothetical protein
MEHSPSFLPAHERYRAKIKNDFLYYDRAFEPRVISSRSPCRRVSVVNPRTQQRTPEVRHRIQLHRALIVTLDFRPAAYQ